MKALYHGGSIVCHNCSKLENTGEITQRLATLIQAHLYQYPGFCTGLNCFP